MPEAVSKPLLSLRGEAVPDDPVFASRKGGSRLTERAVLGTVKRAAAAAGLEAPVSPHWLRHALASYAIDRGGATLGHGNMMMTSGYVHTRAESPSGVRLDRGVFLR